MFGYHTEAAGSAGVRKVLSLDCVRDTEWDNQTGATVTFSASLTDKYIHVILKGWTENDKGLISC